MFVRKLMKNKDWPINLVLDFKISIMKTTHCVESGYCYLKAITIKLH